MLEAPDLLPGFVHDIRRELKRARAALRLLRPSIGEAAFGRENRTLRDAARRFAAARDTRVTLQGLGRLIARAPRGASRKALVRMRGQFKQQHARLLRAAGTPAGRATLASALAQSRERTARWRMSQPRRSVLVEALERIYRKGRKALRTTEAHATDRNLHEWRKQVKHLTAALGMLAPLAPRRVATAAKKARMLGDTLGEDRDLALLCRTAALAAPLAGRVQEQRRRLQKKVLKRGRRLARASRAPSSPGYLANTAGQLASALRT